MRVTNKHDGVDKLTTPHIYLTLSLQIHASILHKKVRNEVNMLTVLATSNTNQTVAEQWSGPKLIK